MEDGYPGEPARRSAGAQVHAYERGRTRTAVRGVRRAGLWGPAPPSGPAPVPDGEP